MNRGKPVYSFPELKTPEILQCMADLRVPLSEADLAKPGPPAVQRVFEAFLEIFMGGARAQRALDITGQYQQLNQQQQSQNIDGNAASHGVAAALQVLEYPEIHLDAVSLIAFYRQAQRLMWEVGVEDFSLRDLVRPEPPRLRLLLSAVINFAKFREEQLSVFEELSRRGEEAETERAKLMERETELRARIEAIRLQRHAEEPAVQTVKEQIAALVNELRELKRKQTALSAEIDSLKDRRQQLTDEQSRLGYLVSSARQDSAKLKSRIVHSPEKLLQILAEMTASIAAEKQSLQSLEKRSRDLQARLDQLVDLEKDLKRALHQLDQNEAAWKRADEAQRQCTELRDRAERQRADLRELEQRSGQLKRQHSLAAEKLGKLTSQQELKRQEFAERLTVLRKEYAGLSEERSNLATKMDNTDRIIKEMESKVPLPLS